jgi:hypothetical protein
MRSEQEYFPITKQYAVSIILPPIMTIPTRNLIALVTLQLTDQERNPWSMTMLSPSECSGLVLDVGAKQKMDNHLGIL